MSLLLSFLDKEFKFHLDVCNVNLNEISILNIRGVDYCCISNGIDKKETVNLLQNTYLTEKIDILKKYKNLLPHIRWVKKS